jgi:hypothetical protein
MRDIGCITNPPKDWDSWDTSPRSGPRPGSRSDGADTPSQARTDGCHSKSQHEGKLQASKDESRETNQARIAVHGGVQS